MYITNNAHTCFPELCPAADQANHQAESIDTDAPDIHETHISAVSHMTAWPLEYTSLTLQRALANKMTTTVDTSDDYNCSKAELTIVETCFIQTQSLLTSRLIYV